MKVDNNNFEWLNCGFKEEKIGEELTVKEKIDSNRAQVKQGVVEDGNIFATYDSFVCGKCGFEKAQVIERREDKEEDEIQEEPDNEESETIVGEKQQVMGFWGEVSEPEEETVQEEDKPPEFSLW